MNSFIAYIVQIKSRCTQIIIIHKLTCNEQNYWIWRKSRRV